MRLTAPLAAALATLLSCATALPQIAIRRPNPTGVTLYGNWLRAGFAQQRLLVGSDGQTYLGVWIDTPDGQDSQIMDRAPLDIALVIDNSGSMSGDKIVNARMAATSMVESLAEGDIASLYTFSNTAVQRMPPTRIDRYTRSRFMAAIRGVEPEGGTNMWAGLTAGESGVAQAPPSHGIRRIVVISDGMANVGPSSPQELGDLAARGTESGIQVSAIGVGTEYDERTLAALAVRSSGRLYHLLEPQQMAAILRNEIMLLNQTVASDAYIEIEPCPGMRILGSEIVPGEFVDGRYRMRLGSLPAGQHRELLVRVQIDTAAPVARESASARLIYRDPHQSGASANVAQAVPLRFEVTPDARAAANSRDNRVDAIVASQEAARLQLQAVTLLNQGQAREAAAVLDRAERQVAQAAAEAPSDVRVRRHLEEQRAQLSRGRASAAGAAAAPAPAAAARASALQNNADALGSLGY